MKFKFKTRKDQSKIAKFLEENKVKVKLKTKFPACNVKDILVLFFEFSCWRHIQFWTKLLLKESATEMNLEAEIIYLFLQL